MSGIPICHLLSDSEPLSSQRVLADEITGLDTSYHVVPGAETVEFASTPDKGLIFLFTKGTGTIRSGEATWSISEVSLFIPAPDASVSITAETELSCLVLAMNLDTTDLEELESQKNKHPYFISYSKCKTYSEKIKSEKTVNRTLLPEHTYPRLCIGSVQTAGPDEVAAHKHPILEQLFLGLKGNDCLVRADDAETAFGNNDILHIPLGSSHSVRVEEGADLHYIWIDLFRDHEGMDWITQQHQVNE